MAHVATRMSVAIATSLLLLRKVMVSETALYGDC